MAFTERLALIISAKADQALREIKKVGVEAKSMGAGLFGAGGAVASLGASIKSNLVPGAAAGGAALVAFVADGVSSFLSLAEEVRNFKRASGATAEDSSRFVAVLDDLKISSEAGAAALFKLGREVAAGAPKLDAYNIEIAKNADGTSNLTETLLNVADAYAKAPDQATRSAIAFAAFGKQAQALLPLLEKGRVGLAEFFAGAEDHGQIRSDEDIASARELELAIDDLQDAMRGLQLVGAKALVPFLTTVSEVGEKAISIAEKVQEKTGGLLGKIAAGTFKQLTNPIGGTISLVNDLTNSEDKAKESTEEAGEAAKKAAVDLEALATATKAASSAGKALTKTTEDYGKAVASLADANEDITSASLRLADSEVALSDAHTDVADKERALADAHAGLGSRAKAAADATRALADANRDASRSAEDSAEAVADAQRDVDKQLGLGGGGFDSAVERLQDAQRNQARAAEDSARRIADAAKAQAEAQKEGGQAADVAAAQKALSDSRRQETETANSLAKARRDLALQEQELVKLHAEVTAAAIKTDLATLNSAAATAAAPKPGAPGTVTLESGAVQIFAGAATDAYVQAQIKAAVTQGVRAALDPFKGGR